MSNIEKIRQEIERRKKRWMLVDLPLAIGRYYEDRDILFFIDSLPEETKDAEQAAARYERENRQSILSSVDIVNAFIDGAKWQKEQDEDWLNEELINAHLNWVMTGDRIARESSPMPEDTVVFQKGVAEGRRLERDDGGLAWQDIKSIVQIADKMLDDPKARMEYQNHNEEYYYKRVLDEYDRLHKTQAE